MKIPKGYPRDPNEHILHVPHKKKRSVIDASYRFENHNLFYQLYAGLLRGLALVVLPVWAKFACHFRIKGRENLKKLKGQGAVLIMNHVYFLDIPIACCAAASRKVRYVTLGENLDIPVAGSIIKALGGIPLASDFAGMKAFHRTIVDLLGRKKLVLFCAESALWPYYRGIRPFHRGGFIVAAQAKAPVVPLVITFEDRKRGRPRLIMTVGEPIPSEGKNAKSLCEETHRVFEDMTRTFYGHGAEEDEQAGASCG